MSRGRYIPPMYGVNGEFQAANVAAGRLCLQQCDSCSRMQHPPRDRCANCGSSDYSFPAVSGRGTCHTFATSYRTTDRGWTDAVPYTTVVIELTEGPRVIAAWRGDVHDRPNIGGSVQIQVEPLDGAFAFLWAEALQ